MAKSTLTCSKSGDVFPETLGRRAGKLSYCGYCESVVFGPVADYPLKATPEEFRDLMKTRGAHVTCNP
jgi:hypothetical protein